MKLLSKLGKAAMVSGILIVPGWGAGYFLYKLLQESKKPQFSLRNFIASIKKDLDFKK